MTKKKGAHLNSGKAAKQNGGRGKGAFTKMAASIAAGFMALQLYAGSLKADATTASSMFGAAEREIELLLGTEDTYGTDDLNCDYNASKATYITFAPNGISVSGSGATVSGNCVNVVSGGTYVLTGEANAYVASCVKADKVHLIFDGLKLFSSTFPPIAFMNVEKTVITLKKGTENVLIYGESEKTVAQITANHSKRGGRDNVACYSSALLVKNNLTVNGAGQFSVNAMQGNAIEAGGTLKIVDAKISAQAANHAILGKHGVQCKGSTLTVKAGGSGILSTQVLSNLQIEAGSVIKITAAENGLASESGILINGGYLAVAADQTGLSAKGDIVVSGGTVLLHGAAGSTLQTIAANGTFTVSRGLLLSSAAVCQTLPENAATHSVLLDFPQPLAAGTLLYVSGGDEEVVAAFAPQNSFRSVLLYSPELNKNQTFSVYTGGIAAGGSSDGLYDSASGGNLLRQFTL